ncbi:unnamed protein product [Rhizoctonia solani]|uniref:Transmembrane protein n=1 Tax=Rhizoctonia solani TaxID=456999 RepID=A0A8H2X983_9AGAM|nr:unnamed protein product [Rhizoctonia solani]
MTERTKRQSATQSILQARASANEFEHESGRATRARTRLIVEGFSNLALIATFFAGVQAQLISVTNTDNEGLLAIATNAAFFGGLMFSIFTAVLATLSARWFSILREDDADYLSSRWLCQDSKMDEGDLLRKYLDYQIEQMEQMERIGKAKTSNKCEAGNSPGQIDPTSPTNPTGPGEIINQGDVEPRNSIGPISPISSTSPTSLSKPVDPVDPAVSDKSTSPGTTKSVISDEKFSPLLADARCILHLLRQERGYTPSQLENGVSNEEMNPSMPKSTLREWILSYVLLSPLIVCLPSFALFTTGILLLVWHKQPPAVAIFTSATVFVCIAPLCGFFIKHRHKHVISHIYLGRPSY